MKRLWAAFLVILIAFQYLAFTVKAEDPPSEPEITISGLTSLALGTDRWKVNIDYENGTSEEFIIEGTKSEPTLLSTQSELISTTIHEVEDNQIVQQDVLLGFSYSWSYTLEILGMTLEVLEFNVDLGLPVQIELQYQEPMIVGATYPLFATLTPLDWSSFNEFTCNFLVIGRTIFDISQSFTTPIGPENAWTIEIGPFWFVNGISFLLFTLDLGLAIVPQLFSDHVEALLEVAGDATLQSPDTLVWNAPGQTLQFNVLAENVSALDYASILLSQFEYFLNKLLIDFNLALQFNWLWGGSSRRDFRLFTIDASRLLPTLSFGTHPLSPTSEIQAEVPVIKMNNAIPEVPFGTIVASAAMIIALIAYVTVPKCRRKRRQINI